MKKYDCKLIKFLEDFFNVRLNAFQRLVIRTMHLVDKIKERNKRMDFVNSLESQMLFCINEPFYRCGVYLKYIDEEYFVNNAKFICEIVKDMCNENELYNDSIDCIRYSSNDSCVRFKNGSFIKIIKTSDNSRGYRFNGIIIDNKISIREKNDYIYPYLIPLRDNDNGLLRKDDKPFDRIFTCDINF